MTLNRITRYSLSVLLLGTVSGCWAPDDGSLPWLITDIGPRLHVDGKSAQWDARSLKLGKSGFTAHAGFTCYTNPNDGAGHYSIDVEYVMANSSRVCFQRDIALLDLPKHFNGNDLAAILSFDEANRVVRFLIGTVEYKYTLPIPP